MMSLVGTVFVVAALVLIAVGTPIGIYYSLRMARHRIDAPPSMHDFWGLNRVNLLFFPKLLDTAGQQLRKKALRGWAYAIVGELLLVASMMLGTFGPMAKS